MNPPKIAFLTIALDAMNFLPTQFHTFSQLPQVIDWTWYVSEGRADNVGDTSWCKKLPGRLSRDGTTTYLNSLRGHPRVKVFRQQLWPGKVAMYEPMLADIREPCILLQVDADEFYTPEKIGKILDLFIRNPEIKCARFDCQYFVGPNIITVTDGAYGHNSGEWLRAFRFEPGMKMLSHEPPKIEGIDDGSPHLCFDRDATRQRGIWFAHFAYAYAQQVMDKEQYYGYKDALVHWYRLQNNTVWPTKLKQWLPWSDDRAMADLLYKK
jgi:hypothetical protein